MKTKLNILIVFVLLGSLLLTACGSASENPDAPLPAFDENAQSADAPESTATPNVQAAINATMNASQPDFDATIAAGVAGTQNALPSATATVPFTPTATSTSVPVMPTSTIVPVQPTATSTIVPAQPTATFVSQPTATSVSDLACTNDVTGLNTYHFTGNGWADDAYLPKPNPVGFTVAWRPWQTTNGQANLPWLLLWLDPEASNTVTVTIPDAYKLHGEGTGYFVIDFALDNRALEQLKDRGETGKDPFDTFCDGDWSGYCRKNGDTLSLYLDKGAYSVLNANGDWIDMSKNWQQVLLPQKGSNNSFALVIKFHANGNFNLHLGGSELNPTGDGWHSEMKLPAASDCR